VNWIKENWFKILIVILFGVTVAGYNSFAHPGRTDSSGGHTCRTNCTERWGLNYGEYHYHSSSPRPSPYTLPSNPKVKGITEENNDRGSGIGGVLIGIILGGGGYWVYKKIQGQDK